MSNISHIYGSYSDALVPGGKIVLHSIAGASCALIQFWALLRSAPLRLASLRLAPLRLAPLRLTPLKSVSRKTPLRLAPLRSAIAKEITGCSCFFRSFPFCVYFPLSESIVIRSNSDRNPITCHFPFPSKLGSFSSASVDALVTCCKSLSSLILPSKKTVVS